MAVWGLGHFVSVFLQRPLEQGLGRGLWVSRMPRSWGILSRGRWGALDPCLPDPAELLHGAEQSDG